MRFNSSSKTSQSRLVKISGRMKSLNFGASCAPRMLHAASQIQDSSDLSLGLLIVPRKPDAGKVTNRCCGFGSQFLALPIAHPERADHLDASPGVSLVGTMG